MPRLVERVAELLEETKTRMKTRPFLFGEGRLIDTVSQRADNRRPGLMKKGLGKLEDWKIGEKVFRGGR